MSNVAEILNALEVGESERAALLPLFNSIATVPVPLAEVFETDGTNITPITNATGPKRDSANGDTDSQIVMTWVASNSDAVIFTTSVPPHVSAGDVATIYVRIKAGGTTDTPTLAADLYVNEGDTKVEFTSAAVSSVYQDLSFHIGGSNMPANPKTLTCEITPGAHTTDTLVLSAIWVVYS